MKNLLFALTACALCASVAGAAPASKPVAKAAPAKVVATSAARKTAPTKVAQATPNTVKPEGMPGFFPDVPRDHWAFAAVQRLAATGIVNGYPAAQMPQPADAKVAAPTVATSQATPERVAEASAPTGEKSASAE